LLLQARLQQIVGETKINVPLLQQVVRKTY
jgi:hypothetical protein